MVSFRNRADREAHARRAQPALGRRRCGGLWGALVAVAACGCGSGEEGPNLIPVEGRVTLDGSPLPRGSVSLRPEAGENSWEQPTGVIGADGRYVIYTHRRRGAPAGSYRAVVFATEELGGGGGKAHPGLPRSIVPTRYNQPETAPAITVSADAPPGAYDLELKSREP